MSQILTLFVTVVLAIGPVAPLGAAEESDQVVDALAARAARVQASREKKVTQEEREAAAARRNLQQRSLDLITPDRPSRILPAPGPGGVPDYFGMTPNWAYSPPLRKFVDGLPGVGPENQNNLGQYLSLGHPDTITYPGSDYYEIEVREYQEQLHSDMPPTTLRGYVQTNMGTDAEGNNTIVPDPIHYLGPSILATKDRPVRVKFTNALPTGEGGDLFIPVDTTYMGAGTGPLGESAPNYTQNRATIHLHGGKTVWISDGTPHQWITPADENTPYPKGVSVKNVPDMPDPGDGSMTFFYSNQQSARMLWYHDHAYGITRLNVYTGMASGYFLTDDMEQQLISSGVLPAEQIPLIIQDKTFTDAETVYTTDPTWNHGSTPGIAQTGDLWMPHVYMPAQNPADITGVNPMGRWHYGPWFWPPTLNIPYPPVPNPYASPDAPWEYELAPGTPDLSSGMEAFQDTPMVNGTPYPTLEVDPKAYRFRILNAANDRSWNLQLYEADPSVVTSDGRRNTEVKMVEAAPNPTFPPDWPVDGREGGVPDPATAGPDWIQVATEGGFLPKPAVFPNQPITWVNDVTLFNAGNVDKHAMLLAPAERSDVVLDFSAYAGKTLILYNDAPAAFPAGDPRYDYYTGAPDMTDTGGHATPEAGFGPNTRTIMQIKVADATPAPAYDLAALEAAFASTPTEPGVFESSQNPVLVPNARYDSTYATSFPEDAYVRIGDKEFNFTTMSGTEVTFTLEPKAIQDEQGETYDEYGRMRGNLGLERPSTVAGVPNFLLYGYQDPATEELTSAGYDAEALTPVLDDGTQIWKITHNGVDTHPMHFHLFDVQLINRVGWDGFLRYPDDNELGWKDTVRISPLEDTIVALRPVPPSPPFNIWDSWRPLDPTKELGSTMGFSRFDPVTAQPYAVPIVNEIRNFNWEYVWHCHILSHEEMDMMRPMTLEVPSDVPTASVLSTPTIVPGGKTELVWTDATPLSDPTSWGNIKSEIGFRIERAFVDGAGVVGPFEPVSSGLANQTTGWDSSIHLNDTYKYRVVAYNDQGETVSNEVTVGPIVDDTHPVTTSDVGTEWRQSTVSVSLVASDTLSGVADTFYTLDGGAAQTYAGPFDVSGEVEHDITFWSVDTSGNVEPVTAQTLRIDDTDPVTTSDLDAGWYRSPRMVTMGASDALSGVRRTYFRIDGGLPRVYAIPFPVSGEGDHTIEYWSVDAAGNEEVHSNGIVRIDDTAPVTTSNMDSAWHTEPFTVTLGGTDALSGVANTYYTIDGGTQQTYSTPFTVSEEGSHSVEFWSVDVAGNIESKGTGSVKVDTSAPVTTSDIDSSWSQDAVTVTLAATDPISGVDVTYYTVDGGPAQIYSEPFVLSGSATHQVTYWSIDVAGNVEAVNTRSVYIDSTLPFTTSDLDTDWHKDPVTVNLTATDAFPGVAGTFYTIDGGATQTYTGPFVIGDEGVHDITYWSEDEAGNAEAPNARQSKIDMTPPMTIDDHLPMYLNYAQIALLPSDALSGVLTTQYLLDGNPVAAGTTVSTTAPGNHTLTYWSIDAAGNMESATMINFSVVSAATTYVNLAGTDRIGTALEVSQATFADGSVDTVVLASAANWPDALVGSSLAGAHGAPILLTYPDVVTSDVLAEVQRLGASKAVILGGTGAIGESVAATLESELGSGSVQRIGGLDRYATARLVAQETISITGDAYDGTAFVATGLNFPDALGAGPLAAANGWPIFLAQGASLGAANADQMDAAGVDSVLVLGGTGAVPDAVAQDISTLVGVTPTRLAGLTRYETAVEVAKYGVASAGLEWDTCALAHGFDFPDALSAGPAQGALGSVLLLTPGDQLHPSVATVLADNKDSIHTFRFLGGEPVLLASVRMAVMDLLN